MQIIQLRLRFPLFDIIPNNSIFVAISETMKIKPHIYEIRYLQECLDLAFNCDNTAQDRNIRSLHQRIVARLQQSGKKSSCKRKNDSEDLRFQWRKWFS